MLCVQYAWYVVERCALAPQMCMHTKISTVPTQLTVPPQQADSSFMQSKGIMLLAMMHRLHECHQCIQLSSAVAALTGTQNLSYTRQPSSCNN
jgi:hypothetical protein